jgi:high-affinity iron transporter
MQNILINNTNMELAMIPSLIITFREVLEMALIVGIVLGYLSQIRRKDYNKVVYAGIGFGILASISGAILFHNLAGGFTGRTEEIFEGITMLIGALLLTTMLFWMMKQRNIATDLKQKIDHQLESQHGWGLFLLVFVSILREGIETVIFLSASNVASESNSLIGGAVGILLAMVVGYLFFFSTKDIDIKRFFNYTSFILVLFAAGLVAHGVHELQEAGIIPVIIEHIWDINPAVVIKGEFPLLHEKGLIGGILKGLFGYNGNPTLLEVISYVIYLVSAAWLWKRETDRKALGMTRPVTTNLVNS